jgi:hypothetical protein
VEAIRATPGRPWYSKFPQDASPQIRAAESVEVQRPTGTQFWAIQVDEGWRSWILCTGMYEWAADDLLARLREHNRPWRGAV